MKPIAPPSIISQGIAVYVPNLVGESAGIVNVSIYYTASNPLFSWLNCDTGKSRIWSKTTTQSAGGTLFLYEQPLKLGFYIIQTSLTKQDGSSIQGQLTLGVIIPTPYLIIGLPYSIYAPIVMS